jgi:hypothetical protein
MKIKRRYPNRKRKPLLEKFMSHVRKTDSCWIWTGCRIESGYGRIKIDGRCILAHRASHEIFIGEIQNGFEVCHSCDVKFCVNPKHLFVGTRKDNMEDKVFKKKQWRPKGVLNPKAKLTEENIKEIRRLYIPWQFSQQKLADMFGVSQVQISHIILRKQWPTKQKR